MVSKSFFLMAAGGLVTHTLALTPQFNNHGVYQEQGPPQQGQQGQHGPPQQGQQGQHGPPQQGPPQQGPPQQGQHGQYGPPQQGQQGQQGPPQQGVEPSFSAAAAGSPTPPGQPTSEASVPASITATEGTYGSETASQSTVLSASAFSGSVFSTSINSRFSTVISIPSSSVDTSSIADPVHTSTLTSTSVSTSSVEIPPTVTASSSLPDVGNSTVAVASPSESIARSISSTEAASSSFIPTSSVLGSSVVASSSGGSDTSIIPTSSVPDSSAVASSSGGSDTSIIPTSSVPDSSIVASSSTGSDTPIISAPPVLNSSIVASSSTGSNASNSSLTLLGTKLAEATIAPSTISESSVILSASPSSTLIKASSNVTSPSAGITPSSNLTASSVAASVSKSLPNGGILSIPPSSTAPVASLLASNAACEALMDSSLPPNNSIPTNFQFSGTVRTYYVAAEEATWSYAPSGWDNWLGVPIQSSPHAAAAGYLNLTGSLGADGGVTWQKALYKGYTDATFTTPTEQPAHNGINGPILRAEVNDMIQIMFVNKLSRNYASMHSMGLYYGKQDEGSLYPNTTDGSSPNVQEQDAVPPGGCAVYKWIVTSSQAPYPGQSSRLWAYHSFVNMPSDLSAGLSGPIIVYSSGQMNDTMASHREFVVTTNTHYESKSFLAGTNARNHGGVDFGALIQTDRLVQPHVGNESFWVPQITNFPEVLLSDAQGPIFYTMNGYVLGNGAPYEMCRDDPVLWYVMAFGGASHVFHLHGNNFQYQDQWQASQSINAGEMLTFNMAAQLPGVWQLMCHVSSHNFFGMQQNYVVYETQGGATCPLPPLTAKLAGSP